MQGLKHMIGYEVYFRGKRIGQVDDYLVNEEDWSVPYLAVQTGGELSDAEALASSGSVVSVDRDRKAIEVATGLDDAGTGEIHSAAVRSNLRSGKEIAAYGIQSTDGPCGVCVDLLVDVESWESPYLVVNTNQWFPKRHVLVPTAWVRRVDWQAMQTHVDAHRLMIRRGPRFEPASHDAAFAIR